MDLTADLKLRKWKNGPTESPIRASTPVRNIYDDGLVDDSSRCFWDKAVNLFNPPFWSKTSDTGEDESGASVVVDEDTGGVERRVLPLAVRKPMFERKVDGHLGAVED